MSDPENLELLLDITRVLRKHSAESLENLADRLESSEQRTQLINLLRAAAQVASNARRSASKTARRRIGVKKVTGSDPERSLEAWSRLIMRDLRPSGERRDSKTSVQGRVTFDERGRIIGTGGWIPSSWEGPIPVAVEVRGADGKVTSRTIQLEAQDFLGRIARRAPLREYPEFKSE